MYLQGRGDRAGRRVTAEPCRGTPTLGAMGLVQPISRPGLRASAGWTSLILCSWRWGTVSTPPYKEGLRLTRQKPARPYSQQSWIWVTPRCCASSPKNTLRVPPPWQSPSGLPTPGANPLQVLLLGQPSFSCCGKLLGSRRVQPPAAFAFSGLALSPPPHPHAFLYPLKCPPLKAVGCLTNKGLSKLLVVLGWGHPELSPPAIMDQVQYVGREGEPWKPRRGGLLRPQPRVQGCQLLGLARRSPLP